MIEGLIKRIESGEIHLSFSSLNAFFESPQHFIQYKLKQREQTEAMLLGSIVHCLILEPQEFENRYFLLDDTEICMQAGGLKPRSTTKYKEWKALETAKADGKEIITTPTYSQAAFIVDRFHQNAVAKYWLNKVPQRELAMEWTYKDREFRGFIDGCNMVADDGLIIDLKLMQTADPDKVQRTVFQDNYFMQLAMYRIALQQVHGIEPDTCRCFIIAIDRDGFTSVNKVHEDLLRFGQQRLDYLIKKYNECCVKNKWHEGYEFWSELHGIFTIDRPAYSYK